MKEEVLPILHKKLRHLNNPVTILGFPPTLGGALVAIGLLLVAFSFAFKSYIFIIPAFIYNTIFIIYTQSNIKRVKEMKIGWIDVLLLDGRFKKYTDSEGYLNNIYKK